MWRFTESQNSCVWNKPLESSLPAQNKFNKGKLPRTMSSEVFNISYGEEAP